MIIYKEFITGWSFALVVKNYPLLFPFQNTENTLYSILHIQKPQKVY